MTANRHHFHTGRHISMWRCLVPWGVALALVLLLEAVHRPLALTPLGDLAPRNEKAYQAIYPASSEPAGEILEVEVVATPKGFSARMRVYPERRPWGPSEPVLLQNPRGHRAARGGAVEGRFWPFITPDSGLRVIAPGGGVPPVVYFHQAFDSTWHSGGMPKGFWRMVRQPGVAFGGDAPTWRVEPGWPPGGPLAVRRYVRWCQIALVAGALFAMRNMLPPGRRRGKLRFSLLVPAVILAAIPVAGFLLHEVSWYLLAGCAGAYLLWWRGRHRSG